MTPPDKREWNHAQLMRYLLGALPAEEAERLDELSITDDDFSWRLHEAENDLVDAYVRSELNGDTLQRFHAYYLSSSTRREKVAFAEGLFRFQSQSAKAVTQASRVGSFFSRLFTPRRMVFQFAGAAFLLLLIAGYLLFDNMHLRHEIGDVNVAQSALQQNQRELERELQQQRSTHSISQDGLDAAGKENSDLNKLNTLALLLPPPSRGISSLKTLTVRRNADLVVLLLTLESADYAQYRVMLKDPATNATLWRSSDLETTTIGSRPGVSVSFPVNLLKTKNYIAEVTGLSKTGKAEVIGNYPFRVVVR